MKKISILIIITLISITACMRKKEKIYEDGKLVAYCYVNRFTNEQDGVTVELFPNGQIFKSKNYNNGKADGNYLVFNYYGDTVLHVVYSNDLIWDVLIYRTRDGEDLDFGSVKNGNGEIKIFAFNGELFQKGKIINGYKEGVWYYYRKGEIDDSVLYKKGYRYYDDIRFNISSNYISPPGQTEPYFLENVKLH